MQDQPKHLRIAPKDAKRTQAFGIQKLDGGAWKVRGPNGAEKQVQAFLDTTNKIWWYHLEGDSRIAYWNTTDTE